MTEEAKRKHDAGRQSENKLRRNINSKRKKAEAYHTLGEIFLVWGIFGYVYYVLKQFEKKLLIYGASTLVLIKANGHTEGSTYIWEPETRTLIAGDLVFNQIFPFGADETCEVITWQKVIQELIELNPQTIIRYIFKS